MPKFVPRQRKHKVLARQSQDVAAKAVSIENTNQDILLPVSQTEREVRRQQLRDEIRAQQPRVSSKKQKRLDKYIENKLRKDETNDFLRRLEQEKEKFDVRESQGFVSSKHLSKTITGRKRGWDQYVDGQLQTGQDKADLVGQQSRDIQPTSMKNAQDDFDSEDSFEASHTDAFDGIMAVTPDLDANWLAKKAPPVQGTGLAQPLQFGADGLPIIPVRRKQKGNKKKQQVVEESIVLDSSDSSASISNDTMVQGGEELPWEGFSSEQEAVSDNGTTTSSGDDSNSQPDSENDIDLDNSEDESSEVTSDQDGSSAESNLSEIPERSKIHTRTSAFKTWALQQINEAVGHTPEYSTNDGELQPPPSIPDLSSSSIGPAKPLPELVNGLPAVKGPIRSRVVHTINVERPVHIQEARSQLPILQREQEIMEAIHNNSVVIIKGDTGSGKTTQVPQFLLEAGYGDPSGSTPGIIGITQPRRVAAVSMAKRVGEELGTHGHKVAHQIRFDSSVSAETTVKFMTDGILLRELSHDLLLKRYSAIVIDEAHERSINSDILIGMLSKIVPARMKKDRFNPDPKPLKLIIMSATLNIEDFTHDRLFSRDLKPPVVEAEGRQHRVTTHFARKSRADYLEEVIEKVKRAHHKLPRGGMLVFLTGQNEIRQVQARLRKDLSRSSGTIEPYARQPRMHLAASEVPLEVDDLEFGIDTRNSKNDGETGDEVDIITQSDEEESANEFDISDEEEDEGTKFGESESITKPRRNNKDPYDAVQILPLYSQLPTREQLRVFDPPPENSRLIVLATNVAETSLTIPGIRYVFDCGRSKERKYDLDTGVQKFEVDYISKASAQQRAGRAGRTGPGHCWRLYSSAVYERFFPDHQEPEILRAPAESIVLQIKGFAYPRPVVEFPFPTAPAPQILNRAETLLRNLGSLDVHGRITATGKQLSIFPLSPRLGKIVAVAVKDGDILSACIALVAGLSVSEIFIHEASTSIAEQVDSDDDENHHQKKQQFGRGRAILSRHDKSSDVMRLLTAVLMYVDAADKDTFCSEYFLRPKAMSEVLQLLQQLKGIVQANHASIRIAAAKDPKKWVSGQIKKINLTTAAGYIDQVAVRWDCAPNPPSLAGKPRRAIDVPYLPLIPLTKNSSSELHEKAIFIHPSSVLSRLPPKDLPQYIVYSHLQQSQTRVIGMEQIPKTRMFPLTAVDAASLGYLARNTALIEYGKPIPKTKIEELQGHPKSRICWISTELRGGVAGSYGWNLPPTKVKQVLDIKSASGWRVEEILA